MDMKAAGGALDGFKQFILRGNVVDLAIGVVIGASFGAVVNSMVKDLVTPLIAALGSLPDFSTLAFEVNGSKFMYGNFVNALLSFVIQAAVIYFFVVSPINKLMAKMKAAPAPADPTSKKCSECLSEIPLAAKRCAHCAQQVA
jgi:large conductance mechanosensitive channel